MQYSGFLQEKSLSTVLFVCDGICAQSQSLVWYAPSSSDLLKFYCTQNLS